MVFLLKGSFVSDRNQHIDISHNRDSSFLELKELHNNFDTQQNCVLWLQCESAFANRKLKESSFFLSLFLFFIFFLYVEIK